MKVLVDKLFTSLVGNIGWYGIELADSTIFLSKKKKKILVCKVFQPRKMDKFLGENF